MNDQRLDFGKISKEIQKRNQLKVLIKEKFGSVSAFAFHSEQNLLSWTVIRVLSGDKKKNTSYWLKEIEKTAERLNSDERKISDQQREKIKEVIFFKFGSKAEFNRRYPEYSKSFLTNVTNGKKKFFDKKTAKFFKIICKLEETKSKK